MLDVIAHYWFSGQIPMWVNFLGALIPVIMGIGVIILIIKWKKEEKAQTKRIFK